METFPCGLTIPLLPLQHSVSGMHWDPTGQLLSSCAGETSLKVWSHGNDSWMCRHALGHSTPVTVSEWCPLLGSGENPQLLLAR